jgi:hypothetical protein
MVSIRRRTIGEEEVNRATTGRHEKKVDFEGKVYPKKKPLNPAHIFPKNDKQPKTKITRKTILMFEYVTMRRGRLYSISKEDKRILQ